MKFDEREWLGDPEAAQRKERVLGSSAAAAARARGVRPFPMAAARVLALTSGSEFDVAALVTALERDVALAARVLRLVNSSAFALRVRTSSLRQAVVLLGTSGVRAAVVAGAVLNMFPGQSSATWTALQEHAVSTATLARHLAPEWNLPTDEMFTVAFLHDLGKWILLEQEKDYAAVVGESGEAVGATLERERAAYGFDHAELTEHVLQTWAFPESVSRVAGRHHDPAAGYADELAPRVALLRFCDLVARAIATGTPLDPDELARTEPMTYLELSADWLRDRFDSLAALVRGEPAESGAPVGDHPVLRAIDEDKPVDVCRYCGVAAFGVSCPRCAALLCSAHGAGGALCPDCARALSENLRARGALDLWKAVAALALGAASVPVGLTVHGIAALVPIVFGVLLGGSGFAILVRRARARRAFLTRR